MNLNNIALQAGQVAEVVKIIKAAQLEDGQITVPFAATITPNILTALTNVQPSPLTGNLTIGTPIGQFQIGSRLCFSFVQDATGGRTITWPANFAFTANGAGTANQVGATEFVYNGAKWVQIAGALAFK